MAGEAEKMGNTIRGRILEFCPNGCVLDVFDGTVSVDHTTDAILFQKLLCRRNNPCQHS